MMAGMDWISVSERMPKMSSPQPQDDAMAKDAGAVLLYRVVLIAWIVVMNGYILHRIAQVERVLGNLVVAAQSDAKRLSDLEGK
jgi:hypothetical protein